MSDLDHLERKEKEPRVSYCARVRCSRTIQAPNRLPSGQDQLLSSTAFPKRKERRKKAPLPEERTHIRVRVSSPHLGIPFWMKTPSREKRKLFKFYEVPPPLQHKWENRWYKQWANATSSRRVILLLCCRLVTALVMFLQPMWDISSSSEKEPKSLILLFRSKWQPIALW